MNHYARCINMYDCGRAKRGQRYPIIMTGTEEGYVELPRCKMSISHPSFLYYFVEEIEDET